jgi:hypothetical protein
LTIETDHHLAGLFSQAAWLRLLGQVGFSAKALPHKRGAPRFVGIK